jgi:pre-60S factor REI1
MPLLGATIDTTTTNNMQSRSEHVALRANSSRGDSYYSDNSQQSPNMSINTPDSSPALPDPRFDPSTCLFCPRTNPSLDQNLSHMSASHSFHIQTTNLLVETTTLLGHFHCVINDRCECLYCSKRLRSSEAVRQHMLHKGHCMYDIASGEDAVVKGFYGFEAAGAELESVKAELAARLEDLRISRQELAASIRQDRKKREVESRSAEVSMRDSESGVSDGDDDSQFDDRGDDEIHNDDDDTHLDADDTETSTSSPSSQQLIAPPISRAQARAQHQPSTFESQLSRLRESDRRSLQHLPTSQQRALLATQHKQMEKGGRAAGAKRGALESAGNSFGRLSSVRLVRMPPHTGRVQSLKH